MEACNFPNEVIVRHFCLTLTCKARLWYESLASLDNDWPAFQNKFRWQYSKIGNTPKQLFHAWRTFKFDENTDKIDSYVLRMSQVAAMLNYGEMQILENFKNTLPYQLYLTLIHVNNVSEDFSSCFSNVVSDFLMNKTNFVGGDKLSPVFKHGFLRSEENVFRAIFLHTKCVWEIFSFIIFNICVWLALLPYM